MKTWSTCCGRRRDVDDSVEQIMLNNLDIIKSLKGDGQHKFDFTEIVNLTSSVIDFDISQLHQIELGEGEDSCLHDVMYYGIGAVEAIEGGTVKMLGSNGQTLEIKHLECSVSMGTSPNYQPRAGDVICWKGFRTEGGEWVAAESIFFPPKS